VTPEFVRDAQRSEAPLRSAPPPKEPPAPSVSAPPSAASPSSPVALPAVVRGLKLEVVPPTAPLPAAPVHSAGAPAPTALAVRVTNVSSAPLYLRVGGDDESFELTLTGAGAASVKAPPKPCGEVYIRGRVETLPPGAHVDLPLGHLSSGRRCDTTSHYMTAPGDYELVVELRGHLMSSKTAQDDGDPVVLVSSALKLRAE
jgi:hypothetical protein